MADVEAGQVAQKQKRTIFPVIILAIAIIFIIWLMALFMYPSIYDDFGMGISKQNWMFIGSIVMIILIIVLLVAGFPARAPTAPSVQPEAQIATVAKAPKGVVVTEARPVQATTEMAVVEAEPIVVEAEIVEAELVEEGAAPPKGLEMKKPRLIEYPKKVPGGVYGDTIIRTDPRTKLNLRTLLVRSCMICDRQGKCWEEIMDTIPRDEFLENIDCKKGLRKLKGHEVEGEPPKKMKKKRVMKVKSKSTPKESSEETEGES